MRKRRGNKSLRTNNEKNDLSSIGGLEVYM